MSKVTYGYNTDGYTEEATPTFLNRKYIRKHKKNVLQETFVYDNNNNLPEKEFYKYNNNGKLLEAKYYSSSGALLSNLNYEFDSQDNQTLYERYKNGNLETRWKYQYTKFDGYGNWIQRINFLDLDNGYWYIEERKIEYYE